MDGFTLAVFCISLVSLTTIVYLFRLGKTSTPTTHLPPSPPKLPIIGHLHLLTDMPHHSFARLASQYGPIIYLKLGQIPTVVVSSAQLAEQVLKTHDHIFSNRPYLASAEILSLGSSDVTFSNGPYWRQARKICVNELLSGKRVKSFQVVRDEEVSRLVQAVSTRSGVETNMRELLFRLSNDMFCLVAFGKRFLPDESGPNSSVPSLVRILAESQALASGFCIGDFYPDFEWVNSVTGMKRRLVKNLKELSDICDDIVNEHSKNSVGSRKEDFLDVLLSVHEQQQQDMEVPLTIQNVKAIVLDMFIGGSDSASATIEWTMTELMRHPEVMKKVQDEIRGIVGNKGEVEESHLHQFQYLRCAIKETLRLHPAVPLLIPRESTQKCTLNGYDVPEKTRVMVNAYAIGRDPDSWENPLVFDPERFVGKDIEFYGQDYRFMPFGGGRRGCPGGTFALALVEAALARLLYHFDWQLPSGIRPSDVDIEEFFGLTIGKKTPLKLVPSRYKNHEAQE